MNPELVTYEMFCRNYDNEEVCVRALFEAKWPDGFCCPRCAHRHAYPIRTRRLPLYECRACRLQTSVTAGTVMEGSRTHLSLWFQAIYLHSLPSGVSASHLSRIIGVTYKTAWLMCHKLRHAMIHANESELLSGLVRVNASVYGRPYNPTCHWHRQEQPLLIGSSTNHQGEILRVKIQQVAETDLRDRFILHSASRAFIEKHVKPGDAEVICVTERYSRLRCRSLIQISKEACRWINDTFRGIGPKHLQAYLDQFCFRLNCTKKNLLIFGQLIRWCASTPTLTYPILTRRESLAPLLKDTIWNNSHSFRKAG